LQSDKRDQELEEKDAEALEEAKGDEEEKEEEEIREAVDVYVTMTNEPKQIWQSQAMQKSAAGKLSSLKNSVIGMLSEKLGKKAKQ
jgi:hypothetical protein